MNTRFPFENVRTNANSSIQFKLWKMRIQSQPKVDGYEALT